MSLNTLQQALFGVLLCLEYLVLSTNAATVSHDFNVTWVIANPDGAHNRPTIGINGKWPIPRIDANVGDQIVIKVNNQLGNQSTSLHFHGLFMNGSTHMDGPSQVSQCAIPAGSSFTYDFRVEQPGTYWYHSHTMSQYPDGLRGPLVIHDPDSPYKDDYDEDLVVTFSDWYHDQMQHHIPQFLAKGNPTGAEPVPQAALINDTQDLLVPVEPGKKYLLRLINIGAFAGQYIWFEGHSVTVVEVDGVYTMPVETDMIYLSAAQRCGVILTTKNDTAANFAIVGSMDTTLFDVLPDDLNHNVTGWLVYNDEKPLPNAKIIQTFDPLDDMDLVPYDEQERLPEPDRVVKLDVDMINLGDGANYAFFNNITYVAPKVPTLMTALSSGEIATDPRIYGEYTHPFVLDKDEVVQIVLNNLDDGRHPFHLHGHHFQALYRSPEGSGTFDESGLMEHDFSSVPIRRDTITVEPNGNIVLRFRANNPGVWLFHCHIEWHIASGLTATFVEAPLDLQRSIEIPRDHLDACDASLIPTKGNAAASDQDFLDLSGQHKPPAPLPEGFTPRGTVALIISCICGIIGVGVVGWYGMTPDQDDDELKAWVVDGNIESENENGGSDGNNQGESDEQGGDGIEEAIQAPSAR